MTLKAPASTAKTGSLRWTIGMAAQEFGMHQRTVSKKLSAAHISPGTDHRYSTKDIVQSVVRRYPDERKRLLTAQADRIELEIEQSRAKLLDRETVLSLHEAIFASLGQVILASNLTDLEKSEAIKEMRHGI